MTLCTYSVHGDLTGAREAAPGPGAAWIIVTVSHNITLNIIISDISTSDNVSFIPTTNNKYEASMVYNTGHLLFKYNINFQFSDGVSGQGRAC